MKLLRCMAAAAAALAVFGAAACSSSSTDQAPTTGPVPAESTSSQHGPVKSPATAPAPAGPGQTTQRMMPNPNGDGSMVPCEGTICTNPNHGAGDDPDENGGAVMPNPNGDGSDVPCEGTICTNPNHGAGDDGEVVREGHRIRLWSNRCRIGAGSAYRMRWGARPLTARRSWMGRVTI